MKRRLSRLVRPYGRRAASPRRLRISEIFKTGFRTERLTGARVPPSENGLSSTLVKAQVPGRPASHLPNHQRRDIMNRTRSVVATAAAIILAAFLPANAAFAR